MTRKNLMITGYLLLVDCSLLYDCEDRQKENVPPGLCTPVLMTAEFFSQKLPRLFPAEFLPLEAFI